MCRVLDVVFDAVLYAVLDVVFEPVLDAVLDAVCSFFAAVQCQSAPTPQHFIKICRSGKRFVGKLLSDLQLLDEIVLKYASLACLAACLLAPPQVHCNKFHQVRPTRH